MWWPVEVRLGALVRRNEMRCPGGPVVHVNCAPPPRGPVRRYYGAADCEAPLAIVTGGGQPPENRPGADGEALARGGESGDLGGEFVLGEIPVALTKLRLP